MTQFPALNDENNYIYELFEPEQLDRRKHSVAHERVSPSNP